MPCMGVHLHGVGPDCIDLNRTAPLKTNLVDNVLPQDTT